MELVFIKVDKGKVSTETTTNMKFITEYLPEGVGYARSISWKEGFLFIIGSEKPTDISQNTYLVLKVINNTYESLTADEIKNINKQLSKEFPANTKLAFAV